MSSWVLGMDCEERSSAFRKGLKIDLQNDFFKGKYKLKNDVQKLQINSEQYEYCPISIKFYSY